MAPPTAEELEKRRRLVLEQTQGDRFRTGSQAEVARALATLNPRFVANQPTTNVVERVRELIQASQGQREIEKKYGIRDEIYAGLTNTSSNLVGTDTPPGQPGIVSTQPAGGSSGLTGAVPGGGGLAAVGLVAAVLVAVAAIVWGGGS